MKYVLTRNSALMALRHNPDLVLEAGRFSSLEKATSSLPKKKAFGLASFFRLNTPLELLVRSFERRYASEFVKGFARSEKFPPGSFLALSEEVGCCSPELLLISIASVLSDVELMLLGLELCGKFSIDRQSERGFSSHKPFTSAAQCRKFCSKAAHMRGASRVRRLLKYVRDGAESPREAKVFLLLTLPMRLGGYGLPEPVLNFKTPVEREDGGVSEFRVDYYWPEAELVAEYDSDTDHTGATKIAQDSERRDALIAAGKQVITITNGQISDVKKSNELASMLAKKLGYRLRFRLRDWQKKNLNLRRELRLRSL